MRISNLKKRITLATLQKRMMFPTCCSTVTASQKEGGGAKKVSGQEKEVKDKTKDTHFIGLIRHEDTEIQTAVV